jgi:hypothetical protein
MAFNPLRALVGLVGSLNDGVSQVKYGPNYKEKVGLLEDELALKRRGAEADVAYREAQTKHLESPDAFSTLLKARTPMRLAKEGDLNTLPGAGSNWVVLSPEEIAAQAGAKKAAENTITGPDGPVDVRSERLKMSADSIRQRYEAMYQASQDRNERQRIQQEFTREMKAFEIANRRDRFQLGTDAETGGATRVNMDTGESAVVPGVRKTPPSFDERQAKAGLQGIFSDLDQITGIVKSNPDSVGPWSQAMLAVSKYVGGTDPNAKAIQMKVREGLNARLKAMSGSAVSPQEAQRLMAAMPDPMHESGTFMQELALWRQDLEQSMKAFQMGRGPAIPNGAPPNSGGGTGISPERKAAIYQKYGIK